MRRPKPPAPATGSADDVEVEFYEALQRGDIDRLMGLWSDDDEIICVHPGGPRLVGAAAIRASFEAMFANGTIDAGRRSVRRLDIASSAVHSVLERVRVIDRRGRGRSPASSRPTSTSRRRRAGAWSRTTPARARASEVPDDRRDARRSCIEPAAPRCHAHAMHDFRAPRWLPGGNVQTIWPVFFSRRYDGAAPVFRRERWATPDGDFVDVDWLGERRRRAAARAVPRPRGLVASHYAEAFAAEARRARLALRGAALSRLLGRAQPRAARLPLGRLRGGRLDARRAFARCTRGPIVAVGVSLGGNALLRWAEEAGDERRASACAPSPRSRRRSTWPPAATAIGRGFDRQVYTRMFLRTMKPKALAKLAQHPGLFDRRAAARGARPDALRQRLHRAAARLSRRRRLLARAARPSRSCDRIRIPALVLNARNDPFVPALGLPRPGRGRPRTSRSGSRRTAATSASRRPLAGPRRRPCPSSVVGWLADTASALGAQQSRPWTRSSPRPCKKWPNVPHCYGWLALDARGDWYMRDDRIQAAGPFPRVKGSRIEHEKLREFIDRNYEHDDDGALVLPERAAARLRRARGGAVGLAPAPDPTASVVVTSHTGGCRRDAARGLPRRGGPALPRQRPRLRHRPHARHGRRRPTRSSAASGSRRTLASPSCSSASAIACSPGAPRLRA